MRKLARSLSLLALLVVACTPQPRGMPTAVVATANGTAFAIEAIPLTLRVDDPAARQVGKLVWRGGVSLTATRKEFGGWSDIRVSPDGRTLHAISDEGSWLAAGIVYDARGNLSGLGPARMGQLRGLDGRPLTDKNLGDAESLARLPDGAWLVGFERQHRIWRFPAGNEADGQGLAGTPVAFDGPPDLPRQPVNGGLEGMVALADGRLVMLSEELSERAGTTVGWIGVPGNWQRFHYAAAPDFQVTAIARLPDDDFVVLERAFDPVRGVRVRVMRIAAGQLAPGNTVRGEELARLVVPYQVDNLEGVSATRGPRGETLLLLMSDDNFNRLQRTILLQFEVMP